MDISKHEFYEEARSLLIRSRLYRYVAVTFALIGLAVFIFIYFSSVEGHLLEALRRPFIVGALLFPFLPAVVLSLMASRTEDKFYSFVEKNREEEPKEPDE